MQEQRLGRELRVAAVVEVGLQRAHERLLGVQREQLRDARVQQLLGVRRLGGAGQHAVGAEVGPARRGTVLGGARRHAHGQPGVLVRAVRVGQVLARLGEADAHRVHRLVCRAGRCPGGGARVQGDEHEPVVAAHGAERVAGGQRAPELVERDPEPRLLGRPQLHVPFRAGGEHADAARHQQVLGHERLRRLLALGGVGAEQRVQRPPLQLAARLLQLLAPVHRRADLGRAALGQLAVLAAQRLVGVDQPQVAEQHALAADRDAHARLQAELRPRGGPDGLRRGGDALGEVQVADGARRLARQDRRLAHVVVRALGRAVGEQAQPGVVDEHRAVQFRAQLLDEGLDLVIPRGHRAGAYRRRAEPAWAEEGHEHGRDHQRAGLDRQDGLEASSSRGSRRTPCR